MHIHSIQINHNSMWYIVINQQALHCNIIIVSYLNIDIEILFVAFNAIHVPNLYCSAEALYMYKDSYRWELSLHAAGARAGHVLFYQIPLKLFICTKALSMGLSHPHRWRTHKTSWYANWQQVAQDNAWEDNQSFHILTVIIIKQIIYRLFSIISTVLLYYIQMWPFLQRSGGVSLIIVANGYFYHSVIIMSFIAYLPSLLKL